MANVLVRESSLQAIANAIRGKTGGSDTYTPAQMGPAVLAMNGNSAVLGTKVITYNGTFLAADDSLDGYSSVTVSRDPNLHPYAFDFTDGYALNSIWRLPDSHTAGYYHTDLYLVEAGHRYQLCTGSVVGNQYCAVYFASDPTVATTTMPGREVHQIYPVAPPATNATIVTWTAPGDGYLAITKDNTGAEGLKTYVFDITLTETLT